MADTNAADLALARLREIAGRPLPSQAVNPVVADRLVREGLVEEVPLPSPYVLHRGRDCPHLRITEAGKERLADAD